MIANLPDGRVIAVNRDTGEIVWDKMVAGNERVRQRRTILHRADHRRRQGDHRRTARATAGTRGWIAALEAQDGQGAVALVRRAQAGRSRAARRGRTDHNAWKTGGGGLWQTGLLRSRRPGSTIWRHGQSRSRSTIRRRAPATTSTPIRPVALNIDTGKLAWYFQYTPNDSWDYDESRRPHALRHDDRRPGAQDRRPFRAQRVLLHARSHQPADSSRPTQYVNDLNWTIRQRTSSRYTS